MTELKNSKYRHKKNYYVSNKKKIRDVFLNNKKNEYIEEGLTIVDDRNMKCDYCKCVYNIGSHRTHIKTVKHFNNLKNTIKNEEI